MGVADKDFEGVFGLGHDLSTLGQLYDHVGVGAGLVDQQVVHACEGNVRRNCPPEMGDPPLLRLANCPCLRG